MARGSKAKYTAKQKREAERIAEGYKERGYSPKIAEKLSWATVNKLTGGGKKSGSGRGKKVKKPSGKRRVGKVISPTGRIVRRTSAKKKKPVRKKTRRTKVDRRKNPVRRKK